MVWQNVAVFRCRTERMPGVMQKMLDRTSGVVPEALANGLLSEAAKTARTAKAAEWRLDDVPADKLHQQVASTNGGDRNA